MVVFGKSLSSHFLAHKCFEGEMEINPKSREEKYMSKKSIITSIKSTILATLLLATAGTTAMAGDTRGYIPAPSGTAGVLFYYKHTTGFEKYLNGDKVADDFNLKSNIEVLRPVYYSTLGSMPVSIQALIPFGEATLDGASVGNKSYATSGLADPTILGGFWPINNPETKTWLGVSEWIKMPVGQYDNDRVLNLGANQWAFKTEVGFVKGWGNFYLELSPYIEFYTDNDDYTAANRTLEKDYVFGMETHLSYDISKTVLVSLDHYFKKGGETTVENVAMNDEIETHSLQFTLGLALAPKQKLLLQYLQDLSVENGSKTDVFGLRYTYIF